MLMLEWAAWQSGYKCYVEVWAW